jgi:hypothetical protein
VLPLHPSSSATPKPARLAAPAISPGPLPETSSHRQSYRLATQRIDQSTSRDSRSTIAPFLRAGELPSWTRHFHNTRVWEWERRPVRVALLYLETSAGEQLLSHRCWIRAGLAPAGRSGWKRKASIAPQLGHRASFAFAGNPFLRHRIKFSGILTCHDPTSWASKTLTELCVFSGQAPDFFFVENAPPSGPALPHRPHRHRNRQDGHARPSSVTRPCFVS